MMIRWRRQARRAVYARLLLALVLLTTCAGTVQLTAAPPPPGPTIAVAADSAALPVVPGCGRPSSVAPGATADASIQADPALSAGEIRRTYRVHLPTAYTPDTATAVVLAFHGHGGDSAVMEGMTDFSALADRESFIAVYPQGLAGRDGRPFWADIGTIDLGIDDVRFVGDLLDALEGAFCVDTARIYVTGFSNGGGMTALLACRLSDRIAAFAPVAGDFYAVPGGCDPGRPVPILDIHGTADRVVTYYGIPEAINPRWPLPSIPMWLRAWAARDGCTDDPSTTAIDAGVTELEWTGCVANGAVVHYRIEGGGHDWPAAIQGRAVAAVMWDFFRSHSLLGP